MSAPEYSVGDVVTFFTPSGSMRTTRVEARWERMPDFDIEVAGDRPGFDGADVDAQGEPNGKGSWGYDDQIISVNEEAVG